MESHLVTFELKENYLLVKGHGVREGIASQRESASAIYQMVAETGSKFILVDYTEVQIKLLLPDAFNMIKKYEKSMPLYSYVVAVCVFRKLDSDFAHYWQTLGRARGFNIVLCDTLEEAHVRIQELIADASKT